MSKLRSLSEKHDEYAFVAGVLFAVGAGFWVGHSYDAPHGLGAAMMAFVPVYFLSRFLFKVLDTPDAIARRQDP